MAQAETAQRPLVPRLRGAVLDVSQRHWRVLVVAMLALLHMAALRGAHDPSARVLLLAHIGLLLLWQPFLRRERAVTGTQSVLIALGAVAFTWWLNVWLLALWVAAFAAVIGGKVFQQTERWKRRFYFVVLVYLLGLLAVVILPDVAPRRESLAGLEWVGAYGLPMLLVAILFFPVEPELPGRAPVIDFFYSIFMALVLVVLVLGSLAFMNVGRAGFLGALTFTVFFIAGVVLVMGLAWGPRPGYAGLNAFLARHFFSAGQPFERWLRFLADLAQSEAQPERFLAEAVAGLARLPWVAGASWRAAHGEGRSGAQTSHTAEFARDELTLVIYSRYRASPTLHWQSQLLSQLLAEFYAAKLRERKLQESSYMQAVHETGARLTHDVKNLLQSLDALCSVVEGEAKRDSPELLALVRKQLPAISKRLAKTLERLRRPETEAINWIAAGPWWKTLQALYRSEGIEFSAEGVEAGAKVPGALFESVADNLIRNALAKREADPGVRVVVEFRCGQMLELHVADTGAAVPAEVAEKILRGPVPSRRGMGIGLYQAARQAQENGFELVLERNVEGDVCLVLRGKALAA